MAAKRKKTGVKKEVRKISATQPKYWYDPTKHGITQSLLSTWLMCREHCRLAYIEGWQPVKMGIGLHYGGGMHYCLERLYKAIADGESKTSIAHGAYLEWTQQFTASWIQQRRVSSYARVPTTMKKQAEFIQGLMNTTIPRYIERINQTDSLYGDFKRNWIDVEHRFQVAYSVPTSWVVLTGMIDGIFRVRNKKLWLLETKNLAFIDEGAEQETLPVRLQNMFYLVAATKMYPDEEFAGVLQNITRRPLLRQGSDESDSDYFHRVDEDMKKRPDWYFLRFEVQISKEEVKEWEERQLQPMLDDFLRWFEDVKKYRKHGETQYDYMVKEGYHYMNDQALVTKYGQSPFLHAITRGDFSGLIRKKVPHTELEI
jgi:hypothetical protein